MSGKFYNLLGAVGVLALAAVQAWGQAPGPTATSDQDIGQAIEETSGLASDVGSMLFFDALSTGFSRGLTQQVLEGEVVAIGAGVMLAADRVSFDRERQRIEAKGHIVLMSRQQVFLGEELEYRIDTGDFAIKGATMIANDPKVAAQVSQRILGFSERELAFEAARRERANIIRRRKERLKLEAARQATEGRPLDEDIVGRYGVLLEQEDLLKAQENPVLAQITGERKALLKRRRTYYEQSQKMANLRVGGKALPTAYFKIVGARIERTAGNDYFAQDAVWTPCRCAEDEAPAWGFRAARTEAQIGGYADLYHAVLEIKGLPVLYLPYMKVPLKDERQTGFLMPTLGFEKRSGNIFSQPVFFDLGRERDATLSMDVFENRGTRLGIEYRQQFTQYSGWELRLEGIRDRLWMDDRSLRTQYIDLYARELAEAEESAPGSETALSGKQGLVVPNNTWRGAYAWRGLTFFAPRLSLVSNGEITSDHRYTEDLYVPDDFREALFGGRDAKAFSPAKAQVNLDGKDFYLGGGMRYGDNFLAKQRFEGQQVPAHIKLRTRRFDLLAANAPIPITGQISTDVMRITDYKASSEAQGSTPSTSSGAGESGLGDGSWRRIKFDTIAPLSTDSLVQIAHFASAEARYIEHAGLAAPRSEMRSWATGVEFTLPIDGKGELPEFWQFDEDCSSKLKSSELEECESRRSEMLGKRRFVHHLFDLRLRFAVRPTVVRNGPYADPGPGGLAYFATDRFVVGSETDEDVLEEDRMKEQQRITLATNHAWKLFNRSWAETAKTGENAQAAKPTLGAPASVYEQKKEIARRDLLRALEQMRRERDVAVAAKTGQLSRAQTAWLDGRQYELRDEYYENPINFRAEVAYDLLDAEARAAGRRANREAGRNDPLPEPWKDPTAELQITHAGFAFVLGAKYAIYARTARELNLGLSLPAILSTNFALGYNQVKQINLEQNQTTRTRERSLSIATSLIPPVTSYATVRSRVQDDKAPTHTNGIFTAYGFEYRSTSDCWGLQFAREKDYDKDENAASYVLRLSVVFMGQQRALPNVSQSVTREMRDEGSG